MPWQWHSNHGNRARCAVCDCRLKPWNESPTCGKRWKAAFQAHQERMQEKKGGKKLTKAAKKEQTEKHPRAAKKKQNSKLPRAAKKKQKTGWEDEALRGPQSCLRFGLMGCSKLHSYWLISIFIFLTKHPIRWMQTVHICTGCWWLLLLFYQRGSHDPVHICTGCWWLLLLFYQRGSHDQSWAFNGIHLPITFPYLPIKLRNNMKQWQHATPLGKKCLAVTWCSMH